MIQKSMALGLQTNNISELYAIGLALHIIRSHPSSENWINSLRQNNGKKSVSVQILSDSRYCIGVLSKGWNAKKNKELIDWIRCELNALHQRGFVLHFHWVGGHSGIQYNEIADSLANQGVNASKGRKSVDVTKPIQLYKCEERKCRRMKHKKRTVGCLEDENLNNARPIKRRRLNENDMSPPQSPVIGSV